MLVSISLFSCSSPSSPVSTSCLSVKHNVAWFWVPVGRGTTTLKCVYASVCLHNAELIQFSSEHVFHDSFSSKILSSYTEKCDGERTEDSGWREYYERVLYDHNNHFSGTNTVSHHKQNVEYLQGWEKQEAAFFSQSPLALKRQFNPRSKMNSSPLTCSAAYPSGLFLCE